MLCIALCSCGARKTDVSKTEITDKTVVETNIKKTETVAVNDRDQTTTTEEVIEPIDATKEAVYVDKTGTKQILHNVKKRSVTTVKNNNTVTERKADEAVKVVEKKAVTQKTKEKHIDKQQFNPFMLIWLIVPLIGIFIIYINRVKIISWFSSLARYLKYN